MRPPRIQPPQEIDGFEALGRMCVLGLSVLGIGVIAEWFYSQQTAQPTTQNTQTKTQTPPSPKQPTTPPEADVGQTEKKSGGALPYVPLEIRKDR